MALNREKILAKLQGQRLAVPDLLKLHQGWASSVNPNQDLVKDVVANVLQTHAVTPAIVAKLTKGNLDWLVALWYPFANRERLEDLAYFVCWMFLVDDEIDQCSSPGRDSEADFDALCSETLRFAALTMGLEKDGKGLSNEESKDIPRSSIEAVESFRGIGLKLRKAYTAEQRRRFWSELRTTMEGYKTEQSYRLKGKIPPVEDYCTYRYGSSCMGQTVSMIEYSNDHHIPEEIMESPEMKAVQRESVEILWVENDVVSSKKEILGGFIENLVVLSSGPNFIAQQGMDLCVEKLRRAIAQFDEAVAVLETKYVHAERASSQDVHPGNKRTVTEDLELFIKNVRSQCVGTVLWSLNSGRYGLADLQPDESGRMFFTIGEYEEALVTLRGENSA